MSRLWPGARVRRRWWRSLRRSWRSYRRQGPLVQAAIAVAVACVAWLGVNWTYQVVRKPSELFFPVSGSMYKTPVETWREYGTLFRRHSTATIPPELLAALAQVEGSGNPVVRTYWRWSLQHRPFEVYRPASSAVGMYQITDSTFEEAKRYCVHDHVAVEEGAWDDVHACWFNALYARTIPSHAVEMTAAYLDRNVSTILQRTRRTGATAAQQQNLAAMIHLCGAGAAESYARRGFRLLPGQRCGEHSARAYVERVAQMRRAFEAMAAQDP